MVTVRISDINERQMADNERIPLADEAKSKAARLIARDKMEELPTPPPSPWSSRSVRAEMDEDIIAYLADLGAASEARTSDCASRNSTTRRTNDADETFEPLSRLYALAEEILELRERSTKLFRRVRDLEKLKALRNADRRLDESFARNARLDAREEDTAFAESLLNAMLANHREPLQRRSVRSPSAKQLRKPNSDKHSPHEYTAPKISKWTRVKAAFRWERACTNDAEDSASSRFFKAPCADGNSATEYCESPRVWCQPAAASPADTAFEYPPKSFPNNSECVSLKMKEAKKENCPSQRSQSLDSDTITLHNEEEFEPEHVNEADQGRPLIRVTSEKNPSTLSSETERKCAETITKRPALTVTIPPPEEDIRSLSSPEFSSPPPSSAHTSGGNSPQPRKMHRELSAIKDFKRQQSAGEESRMQKQDSKWNKVRRAFLTNSTLSVPLSPIKVSRQMFLQNDQEVPTSYSYSGSVENLDKMTALNSQTDTQRDYNALREKLGVEFHRKLVAWERLKNPSPRATAKEAHEVSFGLLNAQENLLSEERLAPEFRKKLQDWKRAKKGRRGSAPFEQQRLSRRRLTDWQVWRSPSKSEYKSPETELRGSCGSGESFSDGKSRLFDDFVRKVEAWKKVNETSNRDLKNSALDKSNRIGIGATIDESEFLTLEKVLSLFDRHEDKSKEDECFDCDARTYPDGTQNLNSNEVLIQTSVGSYRFEGISQEFTRKLYDWEKYRGISPRSSTFRLLVPNYVPLVGEMNVRTATLTLNEIENNERVSIKTNILKRSKSAGSLITETSVSNCFTRRATSLSSLNHLTDKLKDTDDVNMSPVPIDSSIMEDAAKDMVVDDSEPEAMIVDIEDVIEETASPLERVQPHQTPVYSVAASETTSIAVPLGTVTSTHKSSSVFLVESEENISKKYRESVRWNRKNSNEEDTLQDDVGSRFGTEEVDLTRSLDRKGYCINRFKRVNHDLNENSIVTKKSIYSTELDDGYEAAKGLAQVAERVYGDQRKETSDPMFKEEHKITRILPDHRFYGTNENETIHRGNLGNRSPFTMSIENSTNDRENENEHNRFGLEVSFIIAQSKLATCRYNQDSSTEEQRIMEDGSDDDGTDVILAEGKGDSEYEEITLDASADPDRRSNCDSLPELSADRRLDEINERFQRREGSGSLREELDRRNAFRSLSKIQKDLRRSCILKAASDESIKPKASPRTRQFESIPISSALCANSSTSHGYHRKPTIPTTSLTVSSCREERCFERIIVNEETLNKIVVPTASNSCAKNAKTDSATDFAQEDRRSCATSTDQEAIMKKRRSPTRSVFVKTKRIIFSPFRRTEDSSVPKKEIAYDDDRASFTKSKSKSRSASPKVNRQDALLRISFSLPWPLRPSSRDRELKESVTEDGLADVESGRRSSINEVLSERLQAKQRAQMPQEGSRLKHFPRRKDQSGGSISLVDASVQATPEEQDGASASTNSLAVKREEKRAEFDLPSSDLMHKLQILSNVVAERNGRIGAESSMESHSLRIRRAKEDFLSRRGGPLCHSVAESRSARERRPLGNPGHHYDRVSQDPDDMEKKMSLEVGTSDSREIVEGAARLPSGSVSFLPDRVKSASVGMINVDPDTFKRLTESNRGCESLPRTISKQQESSGPLSKIVNKLKFSRLMRGKDIGEGSMSTVSRLCRQSLLIDVRNDFEKWDVEDREEE